MPKFPLRSLLAALFCLVAILPLGATGPSAHPRVALVIDDGPIPEHNAAFLALFAREHMHVTFSEIGKNVAAHPELTRAVVAAGHEINNHSYTHPHLKTLSDLDLEREIVDTQAAIKKASGYTPKWFWAPFLDSDDRIRGVVHRAGLEEFPWQSQHFIGSLDWEPGTTGQKFFQLCTTGIEDRTVILMHEWPEVTLANLPAVITELKKQGVVFVTFSELVKPPVLSTSSR
jgi:peptidoglycan/xylan/chitin deacetylase (PgdA/CDA1 family)